jgi:hypothetical protein
MFFFLLARLFFVTRVLETISYLLNINQTMLFKTFRFGFLSKFTQIVKIFTLISVNLITFASYSPSEQTLSQGQVTEISLFGIKSYTVGNKEVLSAKLNKTKNKLLVKGLKQGFSEIKLWGERPKTLRFYVISKRGQMNLFSIKNELLGLGLKKVRIMGSRVMANGIINSIAEYRMIRSYQETHKDSVLLNVELSEKTRRKLMQKIYLRFLKNHLDDVSCFTEFIQVHCEISRTVLKEKSFLQHMKKQANELSNYELDMRIIQVEKLDGSEISFGMDQIDFSLNDIVNFGPRLLTNGSQVKLKESEYNLSTLSRPKAIMRLSTPTSLKIGSEIPYVSTTSTGASTTNWKFAGLNIEVVLKKQSNVLSVKYQTQLTRPVANTDITVISGNKQSSQVTIELDKPIQLFEIDLKTDDIEQSNIPRMKGIPILEQLFSSKGKNRTYKKIVALMTIRRK